LLDAAKKVQADAASQQKIADTEARREKNGEPGYQRGAGPKYREALKQKQDADAALAHADAEVAIYEPRLTDANARLDALQAPLKAGEDSIKGELEKIEQQKDAQLVPEGYDAPMAYTALTQLEADPREGRAILFFSRMMMAVLMTIELSYIMVRLWFSPASISTARLISNTKLEAEEINSEYERRSHEIRAGLEKNIGPRPAPPPFRIISREA
jgi:hypothetical protein